MTGSKHSDKPIPTVTEPVGPTNESRIADAVDDMATAADRMADVQEQMYEITDVTLQFTFAHIANEAERLADAQEEANDIAKETLDHMNGNNAILCFSMIICAVFLGVIISISV